MSKRSAFRANRRVREGIHGQRRVQLHVMQTQGAKIAKLVAQNLQALVKEEVENELTRRGYPPQGDSGSTVSAGPAGSQVCGGEASEDVGGDVHEEAPTTSETPRCTLGPVEEDDQCDG
jgi:hypothetical protein